MQCLGMLHTTSSASIELGIPVSTLLSLEARGACGPWQRDTANRRLLSDDDIADVRRYLVARKRAQGRDLEIEPDSQGDV